MIRKMLNASRLQQEVDRRIHQVHALAKPGVGRRDQPMPGRLHQGMHLLPRPAATPGTVTDKEGLFRTHWRFHDVVVEGVIAIVPAGGLV